ncbi:MAG: hypothetical protein AAGK00_19780 [Pseudomonadota bacterium]
MSSDDLPARLVPPEPGAGGRSHWEVTAQGLDVVEELAGRGCHAATIARVLGMHSSTFLDVRKRDPRVEEAYQRGLAREHDALVGNLRELADDGNVVANLFLLKTRHGYREGEAAAVNVSVNTGGVVVLPPKMTMEEFLVEREAAGLAGPKPNPDLADGWDGPPWPGNKG